MSVSANKRLVLAYYDRIVAQSRFDELPDFVSPEYVDHNAPADAPRGPAVVEAHLRAVRTTFPDLVLEVCECITEGEWIAMRVTAQATHLGPWRGVQPTGRRVTLRGINLDRVVDGRICEHHGEADTVGVLFQLGINPFAGPRQDITITAD